MEHDRARWDERYATAAPPRPCAPDAATANGLVEQMPTTGRLLDVACGTGSVTMWALDRGLDVVAVDVSGVAIDTLVASSASDANLDARRVDLDDGLPVDLGTFDVVVCQRFRDPEVIRALPSRVAPDGWLIVTVLSAVGAEQPGPFHAPPGELAELLPTDQPGWITLAITEAAGEASVVLRRSHDNSHDGSRHGGSRT